MNPLIVIGFIIIFILSTRILTKKYINWMYLKVEDAIKERVETDT